MMQKELTRRNFFRRIRAGTIGLGFRVSLFDGIYQYADALTKEEAHALLMKGTVNFIGFRAQEITLNDNFYIRTYSAEVPTKMSRPNGDYCCLKKGIKYHNRPKMNCQENIYLL
jgi:hypothetical protein